HPVVDSFGRGRPLSSNQDLCAPRVIPQQNGPASGSGRHPGRQRNSRARPDRFSASGASHSAVFSLLAGSLLGLTPIADDTTASRFPETLSPAYTGGRG